MPRLNDKIAQKVDEGGGTAALEDGVYVAELVEVEARPGPAGPYWCWIFDVVNDAPVGSGRRLWHNTSLTDQALWKVAETFEAFGVPAATDTDDLIGKRVKLLVERAVIQSGKRMGTVGNNVAAVMSVNQATVDDTPASDDDKWGAAPATGKSLAGTPAYDEPNF
jgi:hypothetical protein